MLGGDVDWLLSQDVQFVLRCRDALLGVQS